MCFLHELLADGTSIRRQTMERLATKLDIFFKAGLPILFLHTFEEIKAVNIIQSVIGQRTLIEWSALGFRTEEGCEDFQPDPD